jgi:hypothetical protein
MRKFMKAQSRKIIASGLVFGSTSAMALDQAAADGKAADALTNIGILGLTGLGITFAIIAWKKGKAALS